MADFSFDQIVSGTVGANVNTTLAGLDNMKSTLAGGLTSTLAGGLTSTLAGETTHHTDSAITLAPVSTASDVKLELAPITASLDSTVDLKPVAVDSCIRVVLGELPPTDVRTPYEQTWSWALLGQELFSLTVRGETTTHVGPGRRHPHVIEGWR
jgi:hypothetical protein